MHMHMTYIHAHDMHMNMTYMHMHMHMFTGAQYIRTRTLWHVLPGHRRPVERGTVRTEPDRPPWQNTGTTGAERAENFGAMSEQDHLPAYWDPREPGRPTLHRAGNRVWLGVGLRAD